MIKVTNNDFSSVVLEDKGYVLVDFNAEWCGPCQMLKPILEELEEKYDNIKFVSINVDEEDNLCERYEVSSIPLLILFKNGKELQRNIGAINKEKLNSILEEL